MGSNYTACRQEAAGCSALDKIQRQIGHPPKKKTVFCVLLLAGPILGSFVDIREWWHVLYQSRSAASEGTRTVEEGGYRGGTIFLFTL